MALSSLGLRKMETTLPQAALYYTVVPSTAASMDTITVASAGSTFQIVDAVVYCGLGAIDGAGGHQVGWAGPSNFPTSGNYSVTVGDLNVAVVISAPPRLSPAGRCAQDATGRPFTMIADQIATSTTANAMFTANAEGYRLVIRSSIYAIGFSTTGRRRQFTQRRHNQRRGCGSVKQLGAVANVWVPLVNMEESTINL